MAALKCKTRNRIRWQPGAHHIPIFIYHFFKNTPFTSSPTLESCGNLRKRYFRLSLDVQCLGDMSAQSWPLQQAACIFSPPDTNANNKYANLHCRIDTQECGTDVKALKLCCLASQLQSALQQALKSTKVNSFNKIASAHDEKERRDPFKSLMTKVLGNETKLSLKNLALAIIFGGAAGFLKVLISTLPPDFLDRWKRLVDEEPKDVSSNPGEPQSGTVIYDRHGVVIATIVSGGYSGKPNPLQSAGPLRPGDIPSAMWQAVVASEDRRFFEHHGIDPRGLSRAVLSMSASGGGSTITQQLVKNMFLTNERKWVRKLVEIILALLLEKQMSKWDILHLYLNKIYWGHGLYGIEAASAFYFGKHPSLLTLGECAMLAGIIPAPELLSPYHDPSRGKKPQARALRRMVEAGFLDAATAENAVEEPLALAIELKEVMAGPWKAPYFVSEVLYELTQKYGQDLILQGGLEVHTTLDLCMQEIAEKVIHDGAAEYDEERVVLADKAIQKTMEKLQNFWKARNNQINEAVAVAVKRARHEAQKLHQKAMAFTLSDTSDVEHSGWEEAESQLVSLAANKAAAAVTSRFSTMEKLLEASLSSYEEEYRKAREARLEGAIVGIDPHDGAVRVLVGGRDYYESNFNRATQAFRSPGSTFKPVVYLTALAEGRERGHVLVDEPYTIGGFTPENYDLKFRGQVTLEEALLKSLNVPTVKLCAEVGVDKVCRMGRILGVETFLPHELTLSLGGCEITPLQLATVYSTIASGGVYRKPHLITRIVASDGRLLQNEQQPSLAVVVDEHAVSELRRLLQGVVERGTGRAARIGRPCAGKTGTSDGYRDVWFAGFTPELSCVVWLGYDDNKPVGGLHPGTGASHAAPLWQQFMVAVHEGVPVRRFHDIGRDKYGSRGPREFEKRSRRPPRIGFQDIRKESRTSEQNVKWKEVWDWEKASVTWEEREKMQEWTITHYKMVEEMRAIKAKWEGFVLEAGKGLSENQIVQLAISWATTLKRKAISDH